MKTNAFFLAVGFLLAISSVSLRAQSISGTVVEEGTGEAVVGANIIITGSTRGAATNQYGFFSIPDLKPGAYLIRISALGFKTDSVRVDLVKQSNTRLTIELKSVTIEMGEVLVQASRGPLESRTVSQVEMPMEQIQRIPSLGGEPDIFKALLLLPGVKSSSEISSGLNIRGGSPDQNLVLLDEMIMYNPYHLGGFLSTFNSDAINHVKLIKGAMPAEYGGRLSSVIDVTMKEGSKDKLHGAGGISMIDSRLTLDGPITEDMTFMVSGRRVYLDVMTKLFSEEALPYYFYDFLAKTNYRLDDNNRFFLSGFFGRDVIENEDDDGQVDWGSTAVNLRWTHVYSDNLFSKLSLVYSDYMFEMEEQENEWDSQSGTSRPTEIFKSVSGIEDISLRGELEYFHNAEHSIKTGVELFSHGFRSDATDQLEEFVELVSDLPKQRSTQISFFAQDEWQINDRLKANIGGRLFYFDRGNYLKAEPRLNVLYTFEDRTVVKAAITGANQFLHLVNRTDLALPIDMWFPSTSRLQPSYSMQYTVGASRPVLDDYLFTVEAYYKTMDHILEFKDNAVFSFLMPLENELTSGKGTAYGAEFMFQRSAGALTGWISYTLSWADRQFPALNNGKPFPPRYDRRHDIACVLNYRIGESWEFTAVWVYSTGQAMTFPVAKYGLEDPDGYSGWNNSNYLYTEKNGYRLPAYHRLDLNFSHSYSWFGWDWKVHLNVYNAYNRMNPFTRYIEDVYDPSTGKTKIEMKQGTILPFVPTVGLSFRF